MEKKLKQLFDYQKFARNSRLDAMLMEAEGRCAALEDDALALVSAAGEPAAYGNHVGAIMLPDPGEDGL